MAWSYNSSDLNTTTSSGRLNSVRLLIGDTDTTDQIMQDEEIVFSLAQTNNNIYYAGSWACHMIASKFSRLVDTRLEGAGETKYSDMAKKYITMSDHLNDLGKRTNGKSLGISAGGIKMSEMLVAEQDTNRVQPKITIKEFDNPRAMNDTPSYFDGI